MKSIKSEIVLILHSIRSAHNVGSLFRTADAAGVTHIILTGYTPQPVNVFGKINKEIAKTALGAEKTIPWEHTARIGLVLKKLKAAGYTSIAIEQDARSVNYRKVEARGNIAFVLGNEVTGLNTTVLTAVDVIAEIPMAGEKESLNVAAAGAVALFQILNR
ncbi:MAG TPA: TrmH family RNA methyltransferase [Candidatus Paceibacterota bacterium]|nr:TrmH family RNA methyltransferase [Candidatus Paceibacterota bacterium]